MAALRLAACAAVLTLLTPFGFGASRADFERVVDFSVDMRTVAAAAEGRAALPRDRLVVLEATVEEIAILDEGPSAFRARITLLSGEWSGLEEVRGYSCYVDFAGSSFVDVFPAASQRESAVGGVTARMRVLVVARALGVVSTPAGGRRALLEGLALRPLR
jgi:hypothetical protein